MNQLPADRMIPILPCRSIDEQVDFYQSVGFEVTYRQKAPNAYAAVRRGAIELQFFTLKGTGQPTRTVRATPSSQMSTSSTPASARP